MNIPETSYAPSEPVNPPTDAGAFWWVADQQESPMDLVSGPFQTREEALEVLELLRPEYPELTLWHHPAE